MKLEAEELEEITKNLLLEGISELNNEIKNIKAIKAQPLREFNRLFQRYLQIFNR